MVVGVEGAHSRSKTGCLTARKQKRRREAGLPQFFIGMSENLPRPNSWVLHHLPLVQSLKLVHFQGAIGNQTTVSVEPPLFGGGLDSRYGLYPDNIL